MVQQDKATNNDIEIITKFKGFEFGDKKLVCTDKFRLQQVLLNLQSNAIKFTPRMGKIKIISELIPSLGQEGVLRVTVKDTGIGISKSDQ